MSRQMSLPLAGLVLICSLPASPVQAAQPTDLTTQGEWMAHFYEHPKPDQLPQWLQAVAAAGGLDQKQSRFPVMVFTAEVAKRFPEKIAHWCRVVENMSSSQRASIAWSFKQAGNLDTRCTEGLTADDLSKLQATKPYSPLSQKPTTPGDLDLLWAVFMATGNERAVDLIIEVLALPLPDKSPPGSVIALLLNGAAKWSLRSNARQHQAVRNILERHLSTSQGQLKDELAAILAKTKN